MGAISGLLDLLGGGRWERDHEYFPYAKGRVVSKKHETLYQTYCHQPGICGTLLPVQSGVNVRERYEIVLQLGRHQFITCNVPLEEYCDLNVRDRVEACLVKSYLQRFGSPYFRGFAVVRKDISWNVTSVRKTN